MGEFLVTEPFDISAAGRRAVRPRQHPPLMQRSFTNRFAKYMVWLSSAVESLLLSGAAKSMTVSCKLKNH